MNDPMIALFDEWTKFESSGPESSGDVARRISQRFVAQVSSDIIKTFDAGETSYSAHRQTADVSVIGKLSAEPLFVELKLWSRRKKTLNVQISEALARSISVRRAASKQIVLYLAVLVTPDVGAHSMREDELVQSASALLIGSDGVGFDRVYVGLAGPISQWYRAEPAHTGPFDYRWFLSDIAGQRANPFQTELEASKRSRAQQESDPNLSPSVLLVGDEWWSTQGGISTFNRTLAIALATRGFEVAMLVASHTTDELLDASEQNVQLHAPDLIPGLVGHASLLTPAATFGEKYSPDLVIGHGRILGPYAYAAQKIQFPGAKRLHIVHTDAESLEAVKGYSPGESRMLKADARRQIEVALSASASMVAGVGPLLTNMIRDELRGAIVKPMTFELVPGLADHGSEPLEPPQRATLLVLGRAEDVEAKGIDIAARAANVADLMLAPKRIDSLIVRGVQPQDEDAMAKLLGALFDPLRLKLRPYTVVAAEMRGDLHSATTVLMPSRHEGFGLSAWEAIAAGVPTLVSEESGLGKLILSIDPKAPEVIPAAEAEETMIERWGKAIARNVDDPESAFARADELRKAIDATYTWDRAVSSIRSHLEIALTADS